MRSYSNEWKELLVNGCIAVAVALVPSIAAMFADGDFRHYFKHIVNKLFKRKESVQADENGDAKDTATLEKVQAEAGKLSANSTHDSSGTSQ